MLEAYVLLLIYFSQKSQRPILNLFLLTAAYPV